jgi:hypothetical protein
MPLLSSIMTAAAAPSMILFIALNPRDSVIELSQTTAIGCLKYFPRTVFFDFVDCPT